MPQPIPERKFMVVTHYNPWLVRGNMLAKPALERFFNTNADDGSAVRAWMPRVDVREEANRFVILADLPGVDPSAIEVQMDKDVLTLKGERSAEPKPEGATFTCSERRFGGFERRFVLPEGADAEGITAVGKHGVLEISIPKKPESAPRRITINA
jgi:HSP20 family protein